MGQLDRSGEDPDFLPTDGIKVEETRDSDTVRRFLREWRRRVIYERAAEPWVVETRQHPPAMTH